MEAHVVAHLRPDRKKGALTFVVAGLPDVGLAKVSDHDRPVDRSHYLAKRELVGEPGQNIAATDAAL